MNHWFTASALQKEYQITKWCTAAWRTECHPEAHRLDEMNICAYSPPRPIFVSLSAIHANTWANAHTHTHVRSMFSQLSQRAMQRNNLFGTRLTALKPSIVCHCWVTDTSCLLTEIRELPALSMPAQTIIRPSFSLWSRQQIILRAEAAIVGTTMAEQDVHHFLKNCLL